MATYTKFNQFGEDLHKGVHNFATHTFKVMLTNTAPVATNAVKGDLTEISAASGYAAGGPTVAMTLSRSGGTTKVTAADVTITAGASIGPFRYAVVYNDTPTSPADPLVCFYDYGSSITLSNVGDSFTIDFDGTNGLFTFT